MGDAADTFRTFCHIGEYGQYGYQNLHRMIATSAPLVLWSPSSTLLESPYCSVRRAEFVNYVRVGQVRIVGREEWLYSSKFRNEHVWREGAPWVEQVDGELRRFAEEDKTKPLLQRRVVVAPPERGLEWARRQLDESPQLVRSIERAVRGKQAPDDFPAGVLEEARRREDDAEAIAIRILRGAKNHGDAINLSGAEAPFLLASADSQFIRWLVKVGDGRVRTVARRELAANRGYAELTAELFELLRAMELAGDVTRLDRFMKSDGHVLLAKWYGRSCTCR